MPDVSVAILTYRRPDLVEQAARGVLRQLDELTMSGRLVVVDNDPAESGRAVVDRIDSLSILYLPEPQPGIPAARNAALDAASDCRLIVFIDDDELPEPGWLAALIESWKRYGCDAVAGPNVRRLAGDEDRWVRESGFFDHAVRANGTVVAGAPTSNLLLDLDTVRRLGLRFDRRFDNTGGSDTLFTRQLTKRGGVIRWCDDAVTSEPVPKERATREWVLARERRVGNTWSRVHLVLAEDGGSMLRTRARLMLSLLEAAAKGAVRFVVGLATRNLRSRARGERDLNWARGVLLGLRGGRVEEYRRPEDDTRPGGDISKKR
jgi:glycosyltransferase involved in cell wall biosynthesis